MKRAVTAVLLLACFAITAKDASAAVRPTWTTPYTLNINDYLPWNSGGSAKAIGMGGAFTAVSDDMGAVEYNPAGLSKISHLDVGVLAIAQRTNSLDATGAKKADWTVVPTNLGAAMKVGPVVLGLSAKKPYFNNIYQNFSTLQTQLAPDSYALYYDKFSDKIETDGLETYVLTGAIDLGHLALGANLNYIKGDVTREVRGFRTDRAGQSDSQFHSTDRVAFKGYTMDFGALASFGFLRLGASAKNMLGKVDTTQKYYWQDNGAQGSEAMTWIYAPGAVSSSLTKFAPTYSAGAAIVLGKFFTLDADYVTTNLDSGTDKALGRLGAELWVIPGFLAGRGGVQSDFKNLSTYSNPKAMQYFLGAGIKLFALTVDAAAAYSQVTQGSDGGNFTGAVSGTLKF